ncbi:DUF6289 family protein [Psychrobium sp. MM17-31]|uniref:DUF6289 family protein n=1 Tax=Psychrobium sp. MM17-31 TaxID=2917758 RepID=UPI001EF729B3|nr:DUF6289 family protein [Psychrobium sp. MM17-31]MCG7532465.1 DUF6289 family protein [Psychrobium sp. MM17-31]
MTLKKKALLASIFATAVSSFAYAAFQPTHHVEIEYYSDAAKTKHVGSRIHTCTGRTFGSGSTSQYFVVETTFACNRGGEL